MAPFILAQGLLVGGAGSATFAPMIADTSLWFTRHRGMAVSIIASGSYLVGTVWPPVVQHFIQSAGVTRQSNLSHGTQGRRVRMSSVHQIIPWAYDDLMRLVPYRRIGDGGMTCIPGFATGG